MNNPIEKLKAELSGMTNMQKTVADYIIKNPVDVAFMTLDQFANVINVSTTTIMRLMYYLNYSGYSEFQRGLQTQLRDKVNPGVRLDTNLKEMEGQNIWSQCCEKQLQNIHDTFAMTSEEMLDHVVDSASSARRIYFIAARGGMMVARYMYDFLGRMFGKCQLIHADIITDWCTIIPDINELDLVIAISFPRYAKHITSFLRLARERGVQTVLLTDSYSSPLAEYATILLPCACGSLGFHNSPMAAMMIADSIINVASVRYSEQVKERLNQADKIMCEDKYYII